MLQNEEFIQEFVEEARLHTGQIESDLLELAGNAGDMELINRLFRSVHSIKGTAGFFGLDNIVKLSHAMENLFGAVRNQKIHLEDSSIDTLLESNDCLKEMVEDVGNSHEVDISSFIQKISSFLQEESTPDKAKNTLGLSHTRNSDLRLDKSQQQQVEEAIKHGHKLYRIRLNLYQDLDARGVSPIAFFNKIQSIGQILESYWDASQIEDLDDVLTNDIGYIFLFTTVLEKNLIALALDIAEETIEELDVNIKPGQYRQVLLDGLDKEGNPSYNGPKSPAPAKKQDRGNKKNSGSQKSTATLALEDSIRVPIGLLNDLMNLASELVLGRNQLIRGLEDYRKKIEGIEPVLQNIDNITTQLQERVMHTRMQPLGNVFNKFPRIIRDLSRQLSKEIRLEIQGTQVELDKSIIESLTDPLTHLIRNAADHGIEKPEEREKRGKDREGVISIGAFQEGGHVSILVSDDGAGLDVEALKGKILDRELISQQELANMTEKEIMEQIFAPGFSTASSVTDVSGRGVGMDVVRTNIDRMGGTIEIDSQLGKGTTFKLNLPLTLAIVSSLIVEAKDQKFALPQVNLQEVVRVKPGDKDRQIEKLSDSPVLRFRGGLLPLVDLSQVLELSSSQEILNNFEDSSTIIRILVLKIGQRRFGLIVDAIDDDEEILVKPLPRHLKECRCYSGATILGDGRIAMILDPEGIAGKAQIKFSDVEIDSPKKQVEKSHSEQETMLLFSCSGNEFLSLSLSMVSRVEEISPEDIQLVGDKEYIEFRGRSLRLVRPEDYLPISENDYEDSKLYVIVPKLESHPIGILIGKVHDTVILDRSLSRQDIKAYGIEGTTFWGKKMVLLLSLDQLFEMASPKYHRASESIPGKGE